MGEALERADEVRRRDGAVEAGAEALREEALRGRTVFAEEPLERLGRLATPLGALVFHPHADKHHIKKENIGLIEVMGLAVLPARLKTELYALKDAILAGADLHADETLAKHADWTEALLAKHTFTEDNAMDILLQETGRVFAAVLEDAGVYKRNEAGRAGFLRFVDAVNGA